MVRFDDLLESDRFMSQPPDVQIFYVLCMGIADDFGVLLATCTYLRRRLYNKPPSNAVIERRLQACANADLLRIYFDDEVRHAFIPRFRQRLDRYKGRKSIPPEELISDDEFAKEKFHRFKDKSVKRTTVGLPKGREEKRSEEKRSEEEQKRSEGSTRETQPVDNSRISHVATLLRAAGLEVKFQHHTAMLQAWIEELHATDEQIQDAIELARERKPDGNIPVAYLAPILTEIVRAPAGGNGTAWWADDKATDEMGRRLGIAPRLGESYPEYRARIREKQREERRR
jgi:hypothetical protein